MRRLVHLDALRGIAILLVLLRHKEMSWVWYQPLITFGWAGVDLFFVLSGFLVGGLLISEYRASGRLDFGRFYLRRGLKIYPLFYLLVGLTVSVWYLHGGTFDLPSTLAEGFFVQNYVSGLWGHTWSLAVEEQFYLILPAALLALARLGWRRLPQAVAILMGIALVLRGVTALVVPVFDPYVHQHPTHLRIDTLAFGVLLAYWHQTGQLVCWFGTPRRRLLLGLGSLALISPATVLPLESAFMHTLGFTLLALGFGGLLVVALLGGLPLPRPIVRALAWIGVNSYAIYLWHDPVKVLLGGSQRQSTDPDSLIVYLIVSLIVGALLTRYVERPILRLRDRFVQRSALAQAS